MIKVLTFLAFVLAFALAACGGGAATVAPTALALATAASTTAAPTSVPATATVPPTSIPTTAPTSVPASPTTVPTTPTAAPTTQPTGAPASVRIAVQLADRSIQYLDLSGNETPAYAAKDPADLASIFPPGNVDGSTLYVPLSSSAPTVVRIDPAGAAPLSWIRVPVYGFAANSPMLAWGTADIGTTQPSAQIMISAPNGSGVKTVFQEGYTGFPRVLRVMRWSKDGSRLYFGKEPIGLGGYIIFSGLTNLWSLDPASGKATQLLAAADPKAAICFDDLSPNEKLAADHCQIKSMQVTDIASHAVKAISAPANVADYGAVGGARFSPDNTRLAYGLARNNPDDEQGWLALADVASGKSTLIATSPAKDYFQVSAWLDSNTLLLQSAGQVAGIWTVGADGSNLKRLGDGTFLGILPGGTPAGQASACGEVRMLGPNPPRDQSAQVAEDCFFQAFQACSPATLTVTMMGVDAGTINNFAIEKNGAQCRVVDNVVRYVVPRPTPAPVQATCQGLARQNGGLLFKACGEEGDILVPAP